MLGHGLASRLLGEIEIQARNRGMTRLYAEASEMALPVFQRAGFTLIGRRDFPIGGTPTHNYAVEKRFGPQT